MTRKIALYNYLSSDKINDFKLISNPFKLFSFPTSRSSAAFLCLTVNLPPTNILEEVVAAAAVVVDDDDVEDDWGGMEDGVGRRADVINFGKNKFLEFS